MNIGNKKRSLVFFLGAAVYGAAVFAELAGAQDAAAPAVNKSGSTAIAAPQRADSVTDQELGKNVQAALHADPYFYDEHVSVSVDNGAVVLHGFVSSDWDIRDAMRIARKAAGQRRVVDDLRINDPTIRQGR
jgi:osmotically-inducible protein OsmY